MHNLQAGKSVFWGMEGMDGWDDASQLCEIWLVRWDIFLIIICVGGNCVNSIKAFQRLGILKASRYNNDVGEKTNLCNSW